MRTALLAGIIVAGLAAWLNFGQALSNADFIYMCCGAALADSGRLLVSPYFPPGYPLLVWVLVQAGLVALNAGVLLAALGTGLSAGAVAYMARLWRLPAAPALGLGLLAATLPDVFEIGCNPHVDALYTGLGLVFISAALRALIARPNAGVWLSALLSAVLVLTLRWHAALLVAPVLLVLLCVRRSRRLGLALLVCSLLAAGWCYWALYVTCGSLELAAGKQVAVGYVMRQPDGVDSMHAIYQNYDSFLPQLPRFSWLQAADNIAANYVEFLTRKAVLIGAAAWLLALLIFRRCVPHSAWLLLLIAGYTLAVSPTYFTPRASALPELCGMLLLAAAVSVALPWGQDIHRGAGLRAGQRRPAGAAARAWMDPALAGMLVFLLCLGGAGYNAWREAPLMREWRARRALIELADTQALELTGGHRGQVYGAMDVCGWTQGGKYSLPATSWSRFWLDDPAISPMFDELLPRYAPREVLSGQAPLRVIQLWDERLPARLEALRDELEQSWSWHEVLSDAPGIRLWQRGP